MRVRIPTELWSPDVSCCGLSRCVNSSPFLYCEMRYQDIPALSIGPNWVLVIHDTQSSSICCAQLSRFHLKRKPEISLRNVLLEMKWIMSRIVIFIQDVSKKALQWYSTRYTVTSVTKTFTLKGVETIYRSTPWTPWTMDGLYAFKCKPFRNTHHTVTCGIPLQSSFLNTLHYHWK
jgi:hypothetical protein